jgi:hypothetical protein
MAVDAWDGMNQCLQRVTISLILVSLLGLQRSTMLWRIIDKK